MDAACSSPLVEEDTFVLGVPWGGHCVTGHGVLWHQLKVKGYKATKQGEATSCYKNYCVLGVTPGLHPVPLGYGKWASLWICIVCCDF